MRKLTAILLILCLALPLCAFGEGADKTIVLRIGDPMMTVDGEQKEIDPDRGAAPVIINGRTLVPIRAIIEELGGEVSWSEAAQMVSLKIDELELLLTIGDTRATLRELTWGTIGNVWEIKTTELDASPVIIDGRTMIPARFVMESFGYAVVWDGESQTITIAKPVFEDRVLATVNGEDIYLSDYYVMCAALAADGATVYSGNNDGTIDGKAFGSVISLVIPAQIAESRGLTVTDEDMEFAENMPLFSDGGPYAAACERCLRRFALNEKLMKSLTSEGGECSVAPEEIGWGDDNFTKAQHILVSFDGRTEEEAEARAREVIEKLNGGEDFEALIREYNDDPGMLTNGSYVFAEGEMVDEFYQNARALAVGEYSPAPVRSLYGFHIIRRLPLEDGDYLKTGAARTKELSKLQDLINQWFSKAEITISDDFTVAD